MGRESRRRRGRRRAAAPQYQELEQLLGDRGLETERHPELETERHPKLPSRPVLESSLRGPGKLLVAALAAAALLVLVYFAARGLWSTATLDERPEHARGMIDVQGRDRVVLGDFENKTGDPALDNSIEYLFRVGLEQSPHAQILPATWVRGAIERMQRPPGSVVDRELGIEICRREGAKALIMGSILKIGEIYSLTGTLIEARSGSTLFSTTEQARDPSEIIAATEGVTNAIRIELGESLDSIDRTKPLEKVTTRNLEALGAYTLGAEKIARREDESAIELFERAVRLDPEFAMAHAKLGAYWIYSDMDKAKTHLDIASRLSDRLTEIERLYVDGWLARARGEPQEEAHTWLLLSELYPDDFVGHMNVGMTLWVTKFQFEKAAEAFRKAESATSPEKSLTIKLRLAYCQLALGQIEEEVMAMENPAVATFRVDAQLVRKRYPEALDLIERWQPPLPSEVFQRQLRLAHYAADQGRFEETIEVAHEIEDLGGEEPGLVGRLVRIAALGPLGRDAEARQGLRQTQEIVDKILAEEPKRYGLFPFLLMASIGQLHARHRQLDLLDPILSALEPAAGGLALWESSLQMLHGARLSAQGKDREAVGRLEKALASAETFQAHAGLARAYGRLGEAEAAIMHYGWLVRHRGRASPAGRAARGCRRGRTLGGESRVSNRRRTPEAAAIAHPARKPVASWTYIDACWRQFPEPARRTTS